MAQRQKHIRKVDSTDIMGAGSWVLVKKPTAEEALALQSLQGELNPITGQMENTADPLLMQETLYGLLAKFIIDWDWVDDDGQPLSKPLGNLDVFKQLVDDELTFLAQAVAGNTAAELAKKNGSYAPG